MGTEQDWANIAPREHSVMLGEQTNLTSAEKISLWQKSMESSISGEQAFHVEMSLRISLLYHCEEGKEGVRSKGRVAQIGLSGRKKVPKLGEMC